MKDCGIWVMIHCFSPPTKLSLMKVPLQVGVAKRMGFPFPSAPNQVLPYFTRRYKPSVFLIHFNCKLKWLIPGEGQLIVEGLLFHSVPIHSTEALPSASWEYWSPYGTKPSSFLEQSSILEEASQENQRLLPHAEPRVVAQRFPRGRGSP